MVNAITLPDRSDMIAHVIESLGRYWPQNSDHLLNLPVYSAPRTPQCEVPRYVMVEMPQWASDTAVKRKLLIPVAACLDPANPSWECTDWWLAAFLMLECWPERAFEEAGRPIHSYSFRLTHWDQRLWERAWVNRIALFLRSWVTRELGQSPDALFGPVPKATIVLTHDVDAVEKTVPIRIKQTVFHLFNALRALSRLHLRAAAKKLYAALRFFFVQPIGFCSIRFSTLKRNIEYARTSTFMQRPHEEV